MAHYRDSGVIVRTHKLGEADRILSIITESNGKVRAVAKGVRKAASMEDILNSYATLISILQRAGSLDIVTQAETKDHWPQVRDNLDRLGKALTIAEAVDQIAQDKQPDQELYRMLCGALNTLEKSDPVLVVPAFMLKLLAHEGVAPALDQCVVCGETTNLGFFDSAAGGVTCVAHQRGRAISSSALELMRATLGGALAAVLEVQSAPHTDEVTSITHRLWEFHIERRLRSTELLQ